MLFSVILLLSLFCVFFLIFDPFFVCFIEGEYFDLSANILDHFLILATLQVYQFYPIDAGTKE